MTKHRSFGPDGPTADTVMSAPTAPAVVVDLAVGKATRSSKAAGDRSAITNDDLLRFVDGALEDEGRVRVLTYLAARPAAVERVEAYLHQNAQLKALRDHLPLTDSRDFAAPLQAAIVERLGRNRRLRNWRRIAVAASVALLLIASVAGIAIDHRQGVTEHAAGGSPAAPQAVFLFGSAELNNPVDSTAAAAEPPVLDLAAFSWLADRAADVSVAAPDLQGIGLALIDGDVIERNGSPALRAVYEDANGKPVVLFAGVGKPDVRHAFWLEREGYVSLQWRRGAMIFALVAPTGSPQLSAIVDLVGAAVANIPLPERAGTTTDKAPLTAPATAAEPVPVQAAPAETTEAGPVQSIAVPLAKTAEAPVDPAALADPETIHPDKLADPAAGNVPEPL